MKNWKKNVHINVSIQLSMKNTEKISFIWSENYIQVKAVIKSI